MTDSSYNVHPMQGLTNAAGLSKAHDNDRRKNRREPEKKSSYGLLVEEPIPLNDNKMIEEDDGGNHIDCRM